MHRRVVVAIPVRNEGQRIGACLSALLSQTVLADDILLLLNNCTDETPEICRAVQGGAPQVQLIERNLPAWIASAGEARRLALNAGAALAGDGVLLTSDADSVVPAGWVETNLSEMAKGADVVCGRVRIDLAEASLLPAQLHFEHLQESACFDLLDELDSLIDPDPVDPWPRHREHSGASIALRAPLLVQAGGAPHSPAGEDRELIRKLQLIDARIRHAPDLVVTVSGRIDGRAQGGMAEAMKRRMHRRDELTDERLEPATDALRRSLAKAATRAVWHGGGNVSGLAEDLLIDRTMVTRAMRAPHFGTAWAQIERLSPVLRRRRVASADLARETRQALSLVRQARRQAGDLLVRDLPADRAEARIVAG